MASTPTGLLGGVPRPPRARPGWARPPHTTLRIPAHTLRALPHGRAVPGSTSLVTPRAPTTLLSLFACITTVLYFASTMPRRSTIPRLRLIRLRCVSISTPTPTLSVPRLCQVLFHLLRTLKTPAVPLCRRWRQPSQEIIQLQVLRQSVHVIGCSKNAHPHSYVTLQMPLVWKGFLTAVATARTHPYPHRRETILLPSLPTCLRRPIKLEGTSPNSLWRQEILVYWLRQDVLPHVPAEQTLGGRMRHSRERPVRVPPRRPPDGARAPLDAAHHSSCLLERLNSAGSTISFSRCKLTLAEIPDYLFKKLNYCKCSQNDFACIQCYGLKYFIGTNVHFDF